MLTRDKLQNLLEHTNGHVLSLYLNVDRGYQPNQSEKPAWQIYVENALRDLESDDPQHKEAHQAIEKHTKLYLESYQPSSRTLVLFVTEDGILEDVELPIRMKNYHAVDELDVVPLLWAMDEYEEYIVVLTDQEEARFYSVQLGNTTANEEFTIDFDEYDFGGKQFVFENHSSSSGEYMQTSGGENFEDMKDAHIYRFHKDVAEQIREALKDSPKTRILLGGNEKSSHQIEDLLHESVRKYLVGILPIPVQTDQSKLTEAIRDSATNYERSQELDLVNEVINFAKASGRGALGLDNVRQALEMQQVELLVLPYPMDDEETARELSTMALGNGAKIELVHGSAAARLKQEGKAAARLYYAVPEA